MKKLLLLLLLATGLTQAQNPFNEISAAGFDVVIETNDAKSPYIISKDKKGWFMQDVSDEWGFYYSSGNEVLEMTIPSISYAPVAFKIDVLKDESKLKKRRIRAYQNGTFELLVNNTKKGEKIILDYYPSGYGNRRPLTFIFIKK